MAHKFQGKRVSAYWEVVLDEAAQHVRFQLNSGQRTMAEQRALVREKGVWSPSNPHGAAVPSANAPHIRVGRQDHALDVDMYASQGVKGLTTWLRRQGAHVNYTVPTEGWHIEVPYADLRKLYLRFSKESKLRGELAHIRHVIASQYKGNWAKSPKRRRRAESIKKWLKRHG